VTDPVAFGLARLAEEEVIAVAAAGEDGDWHRKQRDPEYQSRELADVLDSSGETVVYDEGAPSWEEAEHIAQQDPARTLKDIEHKRAILAEHEPRPHWGNRPPPLAQRTEANVKRWFCDCQARDGVIEGEYPCTTVRLLIARWDDHPEYLKEAWAVD
jgi:hypothetical protein